MEDLSKKSNFDYEQFFKWLAIGFSIAGFGIAIALLLLFLTGKKLAF